MSSTDINSRPSLVGACANGVIGVLVFALLPVILGALSDSFDLSDLALGMTASSYYGSYALVTLLSAFWIRRVNWRAATLAGVALMILAMLLPALWPTIAVVVMAFVMAGFGAAAVFGISYAAVGDRTAKDRGFAIKLIPEQFVPALILIVASTWFNQWLVFPNIFVLLAIVIAVTSVMAVGLPARGIADIEPQPQWSDFSPAIVLSLCAMAIYFAGFAGLWAFMERIASEGALDATKTGILLAVGLLSAGVGSAIAAVVANRFARRTLILTGCLISTACLVLLTGDLSLADYGLIMLIVPAAWYFSLAYFFGVIADADHSCRLVGLTAFALASGALSGPTLFALARSIGGTSGGLVFSGACFVTGATIITWVLSRLDLGRSDI